MKPTSTADVFRLASISSFTCIRVLQNWLPPDQLRHSFRRRYDVLMAGGRQLLAETFEPLPRFGMREPYGCLEGKSP